MISPEYQQLVEFLGRQFTEVDRRFDEIDLHFTDLRQDMLGHFDEIYRRLERLEQEYHAITRPFAGSRRDLPESAAGARSWSATSQS